MRRWLFFIVATVLTATSGRAQEATFPYPAMPDSLRQPSERLAFLMEHYWQCYAFADTTLQNRNVGEQGLVDFIDLMQYADSALCARAAVAFADSLAVDAARLAFFDALIEHYLGNPRSPARNDVAYAHLLRALPATPQRLFLLSQVEKNQPGQQAADFAFTDRRGRRQRLYDVQSPYTLVIFSDPDCEHCQALMPQIVGSSALAAHADWLAVLSVYPGDDDALWQRHDVHLPANWTDVRSPECQSAYYLPALPALYLLDEHKRVVVKDGTLDAILQHLNP